jgi:HAD superfamily hydrolase (TIGR01549 family)
LGKGANDLAVDTVLFDIGWTIIDETEAYYLWNDYLSRRVLELTGRAFSGEDMATLENDAITCYAPSSITYVIWQMVRPDKKLFYMLRGEFDSFDCYDHFGIVPGTIDLLEKLYGRFRLGIAANQRREVHGFLEKNGILKFFDSRQVSADLGYSKPDVRLFLEVLRELGAKPENAVMVGDRQDNDIVPAKLVGMKTIRFLTGQHKIQAVRYPKEEPDYVIERLSDVLNIPFISNRL